MCCACRNILQLQITAVSGLKIPTYDVHMTETCLQHCCISDSVSMLADIFVDWASNTNTILHSLMMAYQVEYLSNHD